MTNGELIEVLGRAPSGTEVYMTWDKGQVQFPIDSARIVYVDRVWSVRLDPDLTTGTRPS